MATAKIFLRRYCYAALTIFVVCLSACASINNTVRLYEGAKRPDNEIVKLLMPYELEVVAVDGKKLKTPYVPGGQYKLQLLPGDHEIKVFYEEYWGDSTSGGMKASDVFNFKLATTAGSSYVFKHNGPEDAVGADIDQPASDIKIWVEHQKTGQSLNAAGRGSYGGLLTRTIRQAVTGMEEGQAKTGINPAQKDAESVVKATPTVAPTLANQDDTSALLAEQIISQQNALDRLKFWWKLADEKQRKAFQAWTWTSKAHSK